DLAGRSRASGRRGLLRADARSVVGPHDVRRRAAARVGQAPALALTDKSVRPKCRSTGCGPASLCDSPGTARSWITADWIRPRCSVIAPGRRWTLPTAGTGHQRSWCVARLAARTVAQRIADELQVPLGGTVGYAVRFSDRTSDKTQIKLMTDGLLLAEIQRDRVLRRYDTVIVDEAHERSLNIDFLLGCLHRILPQRPELKLVITSATIDPERFSRHFGDAPIV